MSIQHIHAHLVRTFAIAAVTGVMLLPIPAMAQTTGGTTGTGTGTTVTPTGTTGIGNNPGGGMTNTGGGGSSGWWGIVGLLGLAGLYPTARARRAPVTTGTTTTGKL